MDQSAPEDERANRAPHLTTTAEPVDYQVVVTKKKRFKDSNQPFILDHTLGFLSREGIPKERVTLFVANDEEMNEYRRALEGSEWRDVRIQRSVPGVRDSRNFIYKFFPADTYVVSLDDDMEGITRNVDLRYDLKFGYLKVVELDTRPVSNECVVEDEVPSGPSVSQTVGRAHSVHVRLIEAGTIVVPASIAAALPCIASDCLRLSELAASRISALGGAFSSSQVRFKHEAKLRLTQPDRAVGQVSLSQVSLPCFRILLHWAKTSRLVFAHGRAAELHLALQSLGAKSTAERGLHEWMSKQELKFNLMHTADGIFCILLFTCHDSWPSSLAPQGQTEKPKARKRPRSAPGAKHRATRSKCAKTTAAAAPHLLFAKAVAPTESCELKSKESSIEASAAPANEAKVAASDIEKNDSPLESLKACREAESEKEKHDDVSKDSNLCTANAPETAEEPAEPAEPCKRQKSEASTEPSFLQSKAEQSQHAATPNGLEATPGVGRCDERSTNESREGSAQNGGAMPVTTSDGTNLERTKIQSGEHVTLVLGNQQHRQKSLRSMFAGRSGG
eukprot:Skav220475  [mRNA]  locus=scaffold591:18156:26333:- [translate_table: standard]